MKKLSLLALLLMANLLLNANDTIENERALYCQILQKMESITVSKTNLERLKKELIKQKNELVKIKQQVLTEQEISDDTGKIETVLYEKTSKLELFSAVIGAMILEELPIDQIKELIEQTSTLPMNESIIHDIDTKIEQLNKKIELVSSPKYTEFIVNQKRSLKELYNYCVGSASSTNNITTNSTKSIEKSDSLKEQFKKFDLPIPTLKVPNQK